MKSPTLCKTIHCTGCEACKNSCPEECITMLSDEQGFLQPSINTASCSQCGLCEKSCPVLNAPKVTRQEAPLVYACWHKDEAVRLKSSSGGAFSAFAEAIFEKKGIVYGAAYGDGLKVSHIGVENKSELPRLRGSKYVQSEIGATLKAIKRQLKKGREVFFVGTPCQVAGLHGFLGKDYENLLTTDLVCHGVPSPLVFQRYVESLEKKYKTQFRGINFRDKRHGWENILAVAFSQFDKEYLLKGRQNCYYNGFIRGIFLRTSCYDCKFNGLPRTGDITFADFWGIKQSSKITQKEIDRGISLLMFSNPLKVQKVFSLVDGRLETEERNIEEAIAGNSPIFSPSPRPDNREQFFADLNRLDFDTLVKKYLTPSLKRRLVQLVKENFSSDSLSGLRKLKKYFGI